MPPRKPKLPVDVRVYGEWHHVVVIKPQFWSCLHDGQLTHHPGRLLLDGQPAGKWLPEPKPCKKCRQPCWTADPFGRTTAVHAACAPLAVLPDDMHWQVLFGVAADLGADIIEE